MAQRNAAVAVIGLGEAGRAIAGDLAGVATVIGFDPAGAGPPAGVRAAASPAEAVADASVALACVPASAVVEAATSVAAHLAPGTVYADCATAAPATKRAAAAAIEAGGGGFADVALMGAVPGRGLAVPALVSGPAAATLAARLAEWGMPAEVVSSRAGDAAARKLLRSVFMKGMAAALHEALDAATAAGCEQWLREEVVAELTRADAGLVERLITGTRRHAARRAEEMDAARALLAASGTPSEVTEATAARLRRMAADDAAQPDERADQARRRR